MIENAGSKNSRKRREKKGGLASEPLQAVTGLLRILSRGVPHDPNLEVKL